MSPKNKPWLWIPVLNFASGLPYIIIMELSVILYKNLGISNEDIGYYTSLLYLPWVIKPFWSPLIDLYSTKRNWFLSMQLLISIAFLVVGLSIPTNHFFMITLAFFWMGAFASASNDVATDGFYLLALTKDQQSFFLGIRSTFYRLAMLTGKGLIVILAGTLENMYTDKHKAWSYTMIVVAVLMILITIYNLLLTPKVENVETIDDKSKSGEEKSVFENLSPKPKMSFGEVFASFFKKKQIGIALAFILVFRLGEAQLLKMLSPFMMDPISEGGLGLSTEDVGLIYGTFGVFALVIGGIFGGMAISQYGLRKCMLPMILTMHIPIIGFVLLSHFHPSSAIWIYLAVIAEQFGYGFGFASFMMFLIYVADGEAKTSHYSIATGFMALGMMIPGMYSGDIQHALGYQNFFIWVFIATIPGIILSRYLQYPDDFGKAPDTENRKK